jgi:hypothetical protein
MTAHEDVCTACLDLFYYKVKEDIEAETTHAYRNIDCFYSREHQLFRKTQVMCVGVVITIAV